MDTLKRHATLIIAFVLPVVLILYVVIAIYLPTRSVSTDYDFIYVTCDHGRNYYRYDVCDTIFNRYYEVKDGSLIGKVIVGSELAQIGERVTKSEEREALRFFVHNTQTNEGREMEIKDILSMKLNKLVTSPDGVSVSAGRIGGGSYLLFFDGGSDSGYFLSKGDAKSKLNIISDGTYYSEYDFAFVGWVLPGRSSTSK